MGLEMGGTMPGNAVCSRVKLGPARTALGMKAHH